MSVEDFYEYDPPEPRVSWADQFRQNQEVLKAGAVVVGIPTGLFAVTCVVNYLIKKKLETL
jgi:hypothetical protein